MINIHSLDKINELVRKLKEVEQQIEGIARKGDASRLGVTCEGRYSDELREVAKPVILQHLKSKHTNYVASLKQLGVDV